MTESPTTSNDMNMQPRGPCRPEATTYRSFRAVLPLQKTICDLKSRIGYVFSVQDG